jgi:hypothetical protein
MLNRSHHPWQHPCVFLCSSVSKQGMQWEQLSNFSVTR